MSLVEGEIELIGTPEEAGETRQGQAIRLIVIMDSPRAADEGGAPNYAIDQLGAVRQFVADKRAGEALGLAIYDGRRRNLDRMALSVQLLRPAGAGYSDMQVTALHGLLALLQGRHGLDLEALATIMPDDEGRPRALAYIPPALPLDLGGEVLGAAPLDTPQRLWLWLYGETWRQRGGEPKLNTAFAYYAAKHKLGAPAAANPRTPVPSAKGPINFQPFARDIAFNIGNDWTGVQTYDQLLGDALAPAGPALDLIKAAYDESIKVTERVIGAPITNTKVYKPEWAFHIIAANSSLGPAVSGNYALNLDQQYYFQVFAADTIFTPASEPAGCYLLSRTEPSHPAYQKLWEETYKYAQAPYDPASSFQQRAVQDRLGTPFSGVYETSFEGAPHKLQVFALDTLYAGPDGQIKRMSELPLTPDVANWNATPPKAPPPAPPAQSPGGKAPAVLPKVAPVPNDPNWPPRPNFNILTDHNGARERVLGHIEWRPRGNSREVEILNNWKEQHIVIVEVPQLAKFRLAGNGKVAFHKVAAEQFQRLWREVEAQGLLHLVLTFDGAFYPRVMKSSTRRLSNHSYGTAFDINVKWNDWLKRPALVGQQGSVREIAAIANALGFYWGGHWTNPLDGMHFEWAVPR